MTDLEETEEESVDGNGVGGEGGPGHVVGQEESDAGGQWREVEIQTASTVQYRALVVGSPLAGQADGGAGEADHHQAAQQKQ